MHKKRAHCLVHALKRSPTKGPKRIHEETMRPAGRIVTCMPFVSKIFGRISLERLVSVDAKFSNARRGFPVFRTMFPHRAIRLAGWGYYIKNLGGRGALFASSVSLKKGGVERKLSLGLVRSFFTLLIRDNYLLFSLSTLGSYHWLRTRRLLRLQKTNSSLAPLPLGSRVRSACSRPYGLRTPARGAVTPCRLKCRRVEIGSHPPFFPSLARPRKASPPFR